VGAANLRSLACPTLLNPQAETAISTAKTKFFDIFLSQMFFSNCPNEEKRKCGKGKWKPPQRQRNLVFGVL
jgi:hypothetical protein